MALLRPHSRLSTVVLPGSAVLATLLWLSAASAWAPFGAVAGILLGSAVGATILNVMPLEQVVAWGWRIPFLLGVVVAVWYLRQNETDPRIHGGGLFNAVLVISSIAIILLGVYTVLKVFGVVA